MLCYGMVSTTLMSGLWGSVGFRFVMISFEGGHRFGEGGKESYGAASCLSAEPGIYDGWLLGLGCFARWHCRVVDLPQALSCCLFPLGPLSPTSDRPNRLPSRSIARDARTNQLVCLK